MAGVTEATTLPAGHAFSGLFDEVKSNITAMIKICDTLRADIEDCRALLGQLSINHCTMDDHSVRVRPRARELEKLSPISPLV